jgi:hypothetical protein
MDEYRKEWNAGLRYSIDRQHYDEYVKACHSEIGIFVSELNFNEWLEADMPKSHKVTDGYWSD